MKFLKKISLLLSVVVIYAAMAAPANAKSKVAVDDSFKISVLENLNILSVNEINADFSSESPVTRGQFAVYVARLIDVQPNENVMYYDDLPKTHYAFGMVNTLTGMGVINGSGGSFYPDDYITNEQAIKIIVSVLGYTPYAELKGGYPGGFISVAGDIDLLYGITVPNKQELTKIDAVRLLYNSLDIPQLTISGVGKNISYAVDEEKTFLEQRDIKKYKGQVVSNTVTSISGNVQAAETLVKIGDEYFECGETSIDDYLGQVVSLYYKDENDTNTVLFIEKSYSKVTELAAGDINEFKNSKYYYTTPDSSKEKHIDISSDCNIIYNGRVPRYFNIGYMTPGTGKVRIIDNSDNQSEDVVIITNAEDYVITAADHNEYKLYAEGSKLKELGGMDINVYSANGNSVPFDVIKEGNTVSIAESDDGKYAELYISDKTVAGVAAAVENDTGCSRVVIGNEKYRLLPYVAEPPMLGKRVTLYIDVFGDIGYIKEDTDDGLTFGYMLSVYAPDDETEEVLLKVFNDREKTEKYYIADTVRINDTTYKNKEDRVYEILSSCGEKVIKYRLNSENRIGALYIYENDDPKYIHRMGDGKLKYNSKQQTFEGRVTISDEVVVFVIPDNIDKAAVKTKSSFVNDKFYRVNCLSYGDTPFADVVVMDSSNASYDKYMAVVQKVVGVYDSDDGEEKYRIEVLTEGRERSFLLKDKDVLGNVEAGDVVRLALASTGEVEEIQHIYDRSADEPYLLETNPYLPEPQNNYFSKDRIIYANAYSTDKGLLKITTADPAVAGLADLENCYMSKFYIYKYNDNKRELWSIGRTADIIGYKQSASDYSKVLVGTQWGDPVDIIILN